MFDPVRSVASSAVTALQYVAEQRQEKLSVGQWVAGTDRGKDRGVLFIPYQAGQIAALRSQISAWMRVAIFEAMSQSEPKQRLWFVIDELDAVGQIDGLKDALARLRKFNARCVLGFQSVAQVSTTYGKGEAQTIIENCGNSLILRSSASEGGGTARFASSLIGEREILRTSHSRSRRPTEFLSTHSSSQHVALEAAVLPSQIEQLPDLAGYLKLASRPEWLRVQLTPQPEVIRHQERGYEL
jgi:type IV secretory pathway TraG/TraD family ATPase VirD4